MAHLDDCYHFSSPSDEKSNKCVKWMKVGYVQNLNLALISKRTHCSTLTKNSYIYIYIELYRHVYHIDIYTLKIFILYIDIYIPID